MRIFDDYATLRLPRRIDRLWFDDVVSEVLDDYHEQSRPEGMIAESSVTRLFHQGARRGEMRHRIVRGEARPDCLE